MKSSKDKIAIQNRFLKDINQLKLDMLFWQTFNEVTNNRMKWRLIRVLSYDFELSLLFSACNQYDYGQMGATQTKTLKLLHCVKTCKTEYVYNSRHIVLWLNHASFVTQGLALHLFMWFLILILHRHCQNSLKDRGKYTNRLRHAFDLFWLVRQECVYNVK